MRRNIIAVTQFWITLYSIMLHKKSKMVAVDCNRNAITCQAFVYSGNTAFFIEWVDIIRVLYFLDDNTTRLCILVNMYGRGCLVFVFCDVVIVFNANGKCCVIFFCR